MLNLINKIIWLVATLLIVICGIYFSFITKFPQVKIITLIKKVFSKKNNQTTKASLNLSLASKIGVGSLSGIAFAIYYGGVGSIFWIWVISIIASINCYCENILATKYQKSSKEGCLGGPAYYIKEGLHKNKIASIYAFISIITYLLCFMGIQNNSIVSLISSNTFLTIILSLLISILTFIVIKKGRNKISNLCNIIVPIMSLIYIAIGLSIIIFNMTYIPSIFKTIITSAFLPNSFKGGLIYTIIIGFQRGIFATEAGVGTGAIASSINYTKDLKKQGFLGIISTYFIGIIISTITSVIIILSPYQSLNLSNINGIEITKFAFSYHFGVAGEIFLTLTLILFAFSTIISTYYYSETNYSFLNPKHKSLKLFQIITIITLFISGIASPHIIWQITDIFIAILTIINLSSIYLLKNDIILLHKGKC